MSQNAYAFPQVAQYESLSSFTDGSILQSNVPDIPGPTVNTKNNAIRIAEPTKKLYFVTAFFNILYNIIFPYKKVI
jgi:hypothetical protein